jgi:transcriptional regulator
MNSIAVRQIDYFVTEAQNTLVNIQNLDLDVENERDIQEAAEKARNTSTLVTTFSQPLNETVAKLTKVKEKHESLYKKLDDVEDKTDQARQSAVAAVGINLVDK